MNEEYKEEVATYYDECERDYEIVWQLKDSMALHYGYWDENTLTHRQALWNMNFQLARHAQIQSTDYVLDAGCGIGGTVFFLAQNIGCKVEGISISNTQINRAQSIRKKLALEELTRISHCDFTKMHFEDNTFDVVLGIESIVHAEHKIDFLKEAFRVLKPGGRLIIADYFLRKPQNDLEVQTLKNWGETWAIDDFIYEKEFCEEAKSVGFGKILLDNIAENVFPSVKLMHRSYYPGIFISRISNFFGRRTWAQVLNSKSGKYQYQSYKQGVWNYKFFLAIKPPYDNTIETFDDYIKNPLSIEIFEDSLTFKERFPILSKSGFSVRNFFKRIMHFYLETGIRNNKKWF
jgi:tocopherol O-methyltransferase